MGAPEKKTKATRNAKAHWQLRSHFPDLHEAILTWQSDGGFETLARAIEGLSLDQRKRDKPQLPKDALRAERIDALAIDYVTASQVIASLDALKASVEVSRSAVQAELIAAALEPERVKEYEKLFLDRLAAAEIKQPDLHTGGRKLADATAAFIRQFNAERRGEAGQEPPESYADLVPLRSWADLPRRFAGIQLVDVDPDKVNPLGTIPLPPSTDIATFTDDGRRPALGGTRRATLSAWAALLGRWCATNASRPKLSGMECAVWAALLAHYMRDDASNISNLDGLELVSPWAPDAVVRIVAPAPAKQQVSDTSS